MAEKGATQAGDLPERVVIGISFGNSYSSIACTIDDSAVVIANEDGGETWKPHVILAFFS